MLAVSTPDAGRTIHVHALDCPHRPTDPLTVLVGPHRLAAVRAAHVCRWKCDRWPLETHVAACVEVDQ